MVYFGLGLTYQPEQFLHLRRISQYFDQFNTCPARYCSFNVQMRIILHSAVGSRMMGCQFACLAEAEGRLVAIANSTAELKGNPRRLPLAALLEVTSDCPAEIVFLRSCAVAEPRLLVGFSGTGDCQAFRHPWAPRQCRSSHPLHILAVARQPLLHLKVDSREDHPLRYHSAGTCCPY